MRACLPILRLGSDSCYAEQKSWSVVRREVGYGRYDTEAARDLTAGFYANLSLSVSFFPQTRRSPGQRG